jgi:membrane protease YdiL (CAAX protease family)
MKNMFSFLKTDDSYRQEVSKYGPVDGILAIAVFILVMIAYYWMGFLQANKNIYLGVPVNLFFIALCAGLAILRKGGIGSLGFKKKHAKASSILGLAVGLIVVLGNSAASLTGGASFSPIGTIVSRFFYYLFVISLMEEVVFRGYIQSRIFGLVRNNWAATILGAVMFVLMHIPYQMGAAGIDLYTFVQNNWAWFGLLFMWHLVFTYLFRKYNSIYAPMLFHALMDWGNILFV